MKKIKLKKRRKGINLIIILITSIVITLYIIFNYIGNALTPIIINYAEKQAKKLSILVISSAVDDELSTNFKQDFFVKNGSIKKDPITGEARRVDFVVSDGKKVINSIEVTSLTADKTDQIAKENRIRNAGGNYIRDCNGNVLRYPNDLKTTIERRT